MKYNPTRRFFVLATCACGLYLRPRYAVGKETLDAQVAQPVYNFHVDASSHEKRLLVVFAYFDHVTNRLPHANFLDLTKTKAIFLNPGVNSWYQTGVPGLAYSLSEMLKNLREIRENQFPDHELLCLGHSMGGYAAILAGLSLRASRVLALVPEVTLGLQNSRSAPYLKGIHVEYGDLRPMLRENALTTINVLVGKANGFDVEQADEVLLCPHTRVWQLPADHETLLPYLRDQKKLGPLFADFVQGKELSAVLGPSIEIQNAK